MKSNGPKLVPFFKTVAIYFILFGTDSKLNSVFYCLMKCLPIFSLMFFVLLHGMNFTEAYSYSRKILIGLLFSVIGDAFLVWKQNYFIHGLLSFAVAQIFYSWAFGIRPVKPLSGLIMSFISTSVYLYLLPDLKGEMVYLALLYVSLISFMAWRAVARFQKYDDWPWTSLSGVLGALFFVVSDTVIAVDKFSYPVPYSHQVIMTTYYAAQMLIALSVVDSQAEYAMDISKRTVTGLRRRKFSGKTQ